MNSASTLSEKRTAVAVLSFNKPRLTARCLRSVLVSGWRAEDTLCFDNGSRPEHRQRILREFPDIRHHGVRQNLGFSGGFNRALDALFQAGFEVAFFLTNDTLMTPSTVPAALKKAEESGAQIIAPAIYYEFAPRRLHSIGGHFDPRTVTLGHYQESGLGDRLRPGEDYVPGTAMLITRGAFDTLGGADETYFTYWEDVDLSFRAPRAGILLARAYDSVLLHGVGATCHKNPRYTSYYYQRNRLLFCEKFLSGDSLDRAKDRIREEIRQKLESTRGDTTRGIRKRRSYLERVLREYLP